MNWLKTWYAKHFQKTVASLLGALVLVDFTPYVDDLHNFFGGPKEKWSSLVKLIGVAGIIWRAMQVKKDANPPAN